MSFVHLSNNVTFTHDDNPVAQSHKLRQVGGNQQHAFAGIGDFGNSLVDQNFGADIHPARGFVEDQHIRFGY